MEGPQSVTWKVATSSVRGSGHVLQGIPCQDAVASRVRNGVTAVALCDGAGSAPLSHFGADAVSRAVCDLLTDESVDLEGITSGLVIEHSLSALDFVQRRLGWKTEDYACTLLAVALEGDRFHTVHVGDGAITASVEGEPTLISTPDNGEFACTTTFVTSRDAESRMRMGHHSVGRALSSIALMTDGAANGGLLSSTSGTPSQVVEQICSWLDTAHESEVSVAVGEFLNQVVAKRTQDDCSLAVIRRGDAPLTLFCCPSCKRWGLGRRMGEAERFAATCGACGVTAIEEAKPDGRYPSVARDWVLDLAARRGISKSEVSRVTRIARRTVRKWLKTDAAAYEARKRKMPASEQTTRC